MSKSTLKRELNRAVANHRFEQTEDGGIFVPRAGLRLQGFFDLAVNDESPEVFPNMIVGQYLQSALEQLFGSTSKIGTYYLAPYAGNVSPATGWTAANFTSNSTEFTNYDETERQEWVTGAVTEAAGVYSIGNAASKAQFTIGAGGQTTIWGAGLLSTAAKSSTAGVLVAASKAASARDSLVDGDVITLGYTLTLTDAS